MSFHRDQLDYLQRAGGIAPVDTIGSVIRIPPDLRSLWRVSGIGVPQKELVRESNPSAQPHLPTLELLMGLYGFRVPIAFLVQSKADALSISMGTWLRPGQTETGGQANMILASRQQMMKASLGSIFHSVRVQGTDPSLELPKAAGIVTGIPTVKPPDPDSGALPLDRMVRALRGTTWGCIVLAEPLLESDISELRLAAVEEAKAIQFYLKTLTYPDPLADYYDKLLQATINDYTLGLAIGSWRTNTYLVGDEAGYARLAAVWQGIFSGDQSLHMPIRIRRQPVLPEFARDWAMSDLAGQPGKGSFRHKFAHQTILTSDQLAAYIHLPRLETGGFSVSVVPSFDVIPVPLPPEERAITLGRVISDRRETDTPYQISLKQLRSHAFVAGVTDTGKTNTVFSILTQAASLEVPFLVLEPAKAEYRLLHSLKNLKQPVRVFTLGNERVAPFRLNPFEPVQGTSISVHLDLLRSAFNASFGMWAPLPQVLEQCLHAVYEDKGWNLAANHNPRLNSGFSSLAYPTLTDLLRKVEEITPQLGYDDKISSDIAAALRTRINSLRSGGKGRMLDVRSSIPAQSLFGTPTILEMQEMGDDDDKAFVMALILIRSWEYLKKLGETEDLRHILVIEEAHRLLTNVPSKGGEEANPRAKAVESFTTVLSEVRAWGQGVIVADQVPVRLAPDVIKNTNFKVAHRIVASDDRTAMAGSMSMTEQQARALATLERGEAAVYVRGDDAPLLIKVRSTKKELGTIPSDEAILDAMGEITRALEPPHWGCGATLTEQDTCNKARVIAESSDFQRELLRLILSAESNPGAPQELWPILANLIQARRKASDNNTVLVQCTIARAAEVCADEWGSHASWQYSEVEQFAHSLREVLTAASLRLDSKVTDFKDLLTRVSSQPFAPYSQCETICGKPLRCFYRHAVSRVVRQTEWRSKWHAAAAADLDEDSGRDHAWRAALDVALFLVAGDGTTIQETRTALCFSQQMLAASPELLGETRETAIHNLILTSGLQRG